MTLAIVTFGLSLAVMLGLYWAFVVRPEDARSRELARRVQRIDQPKDAVTTVAAPVSTASVIDVLISSNVQMAAGVQRFLAEAGLAWTTAGLLGRSGLAAMAGALIAGGLTGRPAVAVLGLVAGAIPYLYARRTRTERLRAFEEQFPEAIDLIARSLRAGHAFATGLGIAAEEIPAPVGREFRRVYDEQNFGMAMPDALKGMARRVPVLDARFFVTAVLTQREAGGNLAEVLDNLSGVMRERFKVKRQIRVVSAHGRITALVLLMLPPGLAAVLYTVSPQFLRVLIDDPLGVRLIAFAVAMQLIGTFVISRLVKVEY
ncbi:MAG: type II secretion system F family protein [Acidobacteria bacterium]|nr:type II secretion system F family protein [Acidobacteriota bacterium]